FGNDLARDPSARKGNVERRDRAIESARISSHDLGAESRAIDDLGCAAGVLDDDRLRRILDEEDDVVEILECARGGAVGPFALVPMQGNADEPGDAEVVRLEFRAVPVLPDALAWHQLKTVREVREPGFLEGKLGDSALGGLECLRLGRPVGRHKPNLSVQSSKFKVKTGPYRALGLEL